MILALVSATDNGQQPMQIPPSTAVTVPMTSALCCPFRFISDQRIGLPVQLSLTTSGRKTHEDGINTRAEL